MNRSPQKSPIFEDFDSVWRVNEFLRFITDIMFRNKRERVKVDGTKVKKLLWLNLYRYVIDNMSQYKYFSIMKEI